MTEAADGALFRELVAMFRRYEESPALSCLDKIVGARARLIRDGSCEDSRRLLASELIRLDIKGSILAGTRMTPPDAARWKLAVHPRLNTIIGEYAARHDPAADHGRDEWAGPARPWVEEWGEMAEKGRDEERVARAGDAADCPDQNVWAAKSWVE